MKYRILPEPASAALEALAAIQDKGLGYPKQGIRKNGLPLDPGEGITVCFARPELNAAGTHRMLRMPGVDPDNLPPALEAKLGTDKTTFVAAIKAAVDELPPDWAGPPEK